MKENKQSLPVLGPSARTLGVRPGIDVPAMKPVDIVQPGQGGVSVSPDDPKNLPVFRRPALFQGTGTDPVWMIGEFDLGPNLSYRADASNPNHGYIEPAGSMSLCEYQRSIEQTQPMWQKLSFWPMTGSSANHD